MGVLRVGSHGVASLDQVHHELSPPKLYTSMLSSQILSHAQHSSPGSASSSRGLSAAMVIHSDILSVRPVTQENHHCLSPTSDIPARASIYVQQRPGVESSSVSPPGEKKHSTHVSLSPGATPPDKRHFGVTIPRQDVTYSGRRFRLDPRYVLPHGHSRLRRRKPRSHLDGDSSARHPRSYGTTPRSVTVEQSPRRVLVTSTLHITPRDVSSTASCQGSSYLHTGRGHTRARVERPSVNFV